MNKSLPTKTEVCNFDWPIYLFTLGLPTLLMSNLAGGDLRNEY